ncbi:unnamed protein product [Phaeothamnion confervicola]
MQVIPEVISVYLILLVFHFHYLDVAKLRRYVGFAQQVCTYCNALTLPARQALSELCGTCLPC